MEDTGTPLSAGDPSAGGRDEREAAAERQVTQIIHDTFAQVDEWRQAPTFLPHPGSPLHGDDEQWPHYPVSQLVKVGLYVAAEHLWTIQTLIKARQYQTFAFRSVLRSALVGATQAVWLLAPEDSAARMRRARVLLEVGYRHHLAYLDELTKIDDPDDDTRGSTQLVREAVRERVEQVRRIRADAGEKMRWNDTEAIKVAAQATFRNQPNVDQLVTETLLEWKAGSGAAHGLVWSLLGSAGTNGHGTPDRHGRVVIEANGSLLRVANAYMLAFHTTDYGWSLLNARGSAPA